MKYAEAIQSASQSAKEFTVLCNSDTEASDLQTEASNKRDVACAEVHTQANGHSTPAVTITLHH